MKHGWRSVIRYTAVMMITLLCCTASRSAGAADPFGFLPTRTWQGISYEALPEGSVTNILLIGYDRYDEGQALDNEHAYNRGGQADFLLLVQLDHANKRIHRLQIERDIMTDIRMISSTGEPLKSRTMQICLSHAYGFTMETNNKNTVWAVENLLGIANGMDGAAVDWYVAMDISGISRLNDLLGGVTVPIEDDFSLVDDSMVKGTSMRLTGKQAEYYCRTRYHVGDQTNVSRMRRQEAYMMAAGDLLKQKVRADSGFAPRLLRDMGVRYDTVRPIDDSFGFTIGTEQGTQAGQDYAGRYLMTNTSLDVIVGQLSRAVDYELMDAERLPGQRSIGKSGLIEVWLEDDAAMAWTMKHMYRPVD